MRKAMGLIFDEWVSSAGSSAFYTSADLDGFLPLTDQVGFQINAYNPSAGPGSLTVEFQHSGDDEHWTFRLTTGAQTIIGNSTTPIALLDTGQTPMLPFGRLKITLTGI